MGRKRNLSWEDIDRRINELQPFTLAARIMELNDDLGDREPSNEEIFQYLQRLEKLKKDLKAARLRRKWTKELRPKILGELTKEINKWSEKVRKLKREKI